MYNFAVTGVGGFVAPRHLRAIRVTGNRVIAAVDPHDAVGILDQYSFDARFFTEFERFDRHLEKLRRGPNENRVHYVSVCSPNYLHDAHVRVALRAGADAICEKPLVISPWNLDALQRLEEETGRRVFTVLQLRLHPKLVALRDQLLLERRDREHEVELTYVTARGRWYQTSWKGSEERSGGLAMNIGIHFFDLLQWLFGGVGDREVHVRTSTRMAGFLQLERARVRWYLSTDPATCRPQRSLARPRAFDRSESTDTTSSSPMDSPTFTTRSIAQRWRGEGSASPTRDRRSSSHTSFATPSPGTTPSGIIRGWRAGWRSSADDGRGELLRARIQLRRRRLHDW